MQLSGGGRETDGARVLAEKRVRVDWYAETKGGLFVATEGQVLFPVHKLAKRVFLESR